jgi:hypothetical protein
MKFFLLALLLGLLFWGLTVREVRNAIGAIPTSIWAAVTVALAAATLFFVYAYSGGAIRLF